MNELNTPRFNLIFTQTNSILRLNKYNCIPAFVAIRTKNPDTSKTLNSYAYQDYLGEYFGGTYSGFIEKQRYNDEENKNFDKYYDELEILKEK